MHCDFFIFIHNIISIHLRFCKRKLDELSFFGNILHVTFAPELESVAECRLKLHMRRSQMKSELRRNGKHQILP